MKPKYIADFVCTYNLLDEYESSFWLYQIQILQAFNLEQFDDEKINQVTRQVYERYRENPYIVDILQSDQFKQLDMFDKDDLTKFRSCFSYNSFHLIHSVLCSIINNIAINDANYQKLLLQ